MRTNTIFLVLLACIILSAEGQQKSCPISSSTINLQATDSWQYLRSPETSAQRYPNNVRCVWSITSQDPRRPVLIRTTFMDLEVSFSCQYDFVEISDSSGLRGKFCTSSVPDITSRGNPLFIEFETDFTNSKRGFHIMYKMVDSSAGVENSVILQCISYGFTVEAIGEERYIQSPDYPISYSNNWACMWFLRAHTPGYVVKVVVQDSKLESSSTCSYDYVAAYDGPSVDSTQLQRWCGTQTPTLYSSGQYLTLRFVTDSSGQERGFKLSFKEVPESQRQRPSGLSSGAIIGIVVGVGAPVILCFCCCCCYHCRKKKPGGASSTTAPPRGTTTTYSAPNSGASPQVFYTTTYPSSLGQPTLTNPSSPSAYAPPTYPGPPSQPYPVQNPAYPVGGYTYPQPSAPLQMGGMGGPPAPPTERQESLPSEPPPPYWQASQYELPPGGAKSAATAAEAGSGGGQPVSGGGHSMSGGGQLTAGGGQLTAGGGQTTSGDGQPESGGGQSMSGGGQSMSGGGQSISGGGQPISAGGQPISGGGQLISGGGQHTS